MSGTETMTATPCRWVDLLDPSVEALHNELPPGVHETAIARLLSHHQDHADDPRPRLRAEGTYIFGVFVVPVCIDNDDRVYFQEVDLLVASDRVITCRKTPEGGEAFPRERLERAIADCRQSTAGLMTFHIVDEIAECFLELADELHTKIEELEDGVESWSHEEVRTRIADIRHDLLQVRRALSPTREAVHKIVDNRIEIDGDEPLFPHDVELYFADVGDKLTRTLEALDFSRDILASVRDYLQAKVANDQNDVMQRLTVVASLLLVPTLIVGIYGQNFEHMPELHWFDGYFVSWGLIIAITVAQLVYFRRKEWI